MNPIKSILLLLSMWCGTCVHLSGQSLLPDHLVLTWKEDPMTTQSVTWRTEDRLSSPQVQFMKATPSPYRTEMATSIRTVESRVETEAGKPYFYYSATLTGLVPGTKYMYRVGAEENWTEWHQFRTTSQRDEAFSFIYLGDIQNDVLSWGARTVRAAYAQAPNADFSLFAGDCVDDGHSDEEWMEWFDILGHLSASKSVVPVTGNHEYNTFRGAEEASLSLFWQDQFELPTNGPKGLEESVFYMDYKSMRLVVLNSNVALRSPEELEEQTKWLTSVLESNTQKWIVVSFHHALFSARDGNHGDYPDLRNAWQPIFEKYGVDLVLMGHDHVYARANKKTRNIEVPDGQAGPVYVVSVAGPKMYGIVPERRWMERAAVNTQMYQIVTIEGDELQFRAYTAIGELYDSFDLKKRPGSFNGFIEHIDSATTPENKFPTGRYVRSKD